MNDNDIIKALKWCSKEDYCNTSVCPIYRDMGDDEACATKISELALDLINRQKAEIERLTEENEIKNNKRANIFEIANAYERGRTKAITEFVEEFEKRCISGGIYPAFVKRQLDDVKKEMTEREE